MTILTRKKYTRVDEQIDLSFLDKNKSKFVDEILNSDDTPTISSTTEQVYYNFVKLTLETSFENYKDKLDTELNLQSLKLNDIKRLLITRHIKLLMKTIMNDIDDTIKSQITENSSVSNIYTKTINSGITSSLVSSIYDDVEFTITTFPDAVLSSSHKDTLLTFYNNMDSSSLTTLSRDFDKKMLEIRALERICALFTRNSIQYEDVRIRYPTITNVNLFNVECFDKLPEDVVNNRTCYVQLVTNESIKVGPFSGREGSFEFTTYTRNSEDKITVEHEKDFRTITNGVWQKELETKEIIFSSGSGSGLDYTDSKIIQIRDNFYTMEADFFNLKMTFKPYTSGLYFDIVKNKYGKLKVRINNLIHPIIRTRKGEERLWIFKDNDYDRNNDQIVLKYEYEKEKYRSTPRNTIRSIYDHTHIFHEMELPYTYNLINTYNGSGSGMTLTPVLSYEVNTISGNGDYIYGGGGSSNIRSNGDGIFDSLEMDNMYKDVVYDIKQTIVTDTLFNQSTIGTYSEITAGYTDYDNWVNSQQYTNAGTSIESTIQGNYVKQSNLNKIYKYYASKRLGGEGMTGYAPNVEIVRRDGKLVNHDEEYNYNTLEGEKALLEENYTVELVYTYNDYNSGITIDDLSWKKNEVLQINVINDEYHTNALTLDNTTLYHTLRNGEFFETEVGSGENFPATHYVAQYPAYMKAIFDIQSKIQYSGYDDPIMNQEVILDVYDVELSIVSITCDLEFSGSIATYELDKNSFNFVADTTNKKYTLGLQNGLIKGRENNTDNAMIYINPENGIIKDILVTIRQNYFGKETEYELALFSIHVDSSYSKIINALEEIIVLSNQLMNSGNIENDLSTNVDTKVTTLTNNIAEFNKLNDTFCKSYFKFAVNVARAFQQEAELKEKDLLRFEKGTGIYNVQSVNAFIFPGTKTAGKNQLLAIKNIDTKTYIKNTTSKDELYVLMDEYDSYGRPFMRMGPFTRIEYSSVEYNNVYVHVSLNVDMTSNVYIYHKNYTEIDQTESFVQENNTVPNDLPNSIQINGITEFEVTIEQFEENSIITPKVMKFHSTHGIVKVSLDYKANHYYMFERSIENLNGNIKTKVLINNELTPKLNLQTGTTCTFINTMKNKALYTFQIKKDNEITEYATKGLDLSSINISRTDDNFVIYGNEIKETLDTNKIISQGTSEWLNSNIFRYYGGSNRLHLVHFIRNSNNDGGKYYQFGPVNLNINGEDLRTDRNDIFTQYMVQNLIYEQYENTEAGNVYLNENNKLEGSVPYISGKYTGTLHEELVTELSFTPTEVGTYTYSINNEQLGNIEVTESLVQPQVESLNIDYQITAIEYSSGSGSGIENYSCVVSSGPGDIVTEVVMTVDNFIYDVINVNTGSGSGNYDTIDVKQALDILEVVLTSTNQIVNDNADENDIDCVIYKINDNDGVKETIVDDHFDYKVVTSSGTGTMKGIIGLTRPLIEPTEAGKPNIYSIELNYFGVKEYINLEINVDDIKDKTYGNNRSVFAQCVQSWIALLGMNRIGNDYRRQSNKYLIDQIQEYVIDTVTDPFIMSSLLFSEKSVEIDDSTYNLSKDYVNIYDSTTRAPEEGGFHRAGENYIKYIETYQNFRGSYFSEGDEDGVNHYLDLDKNYIVKLANRKRRNKFEIVLNPNLSICFTRRDVDNNYQSIFVEGFRTDVNVAYLYKKHSNQTVKNIVYGFRIINPFFIPYMLVYRFVKNMLTFKLSQMYVMSHDHVSNITKCNGFDINEYELYLIPNEYYTFDLSSKSIYESDNDDKDTFLHSIIEELENIKENNEVLNDATSSLINVIEVRDDEKNNCAIIIRCLCKDPASLILLNRVLKTQTTYWKFLQFRFQDSTEHLTDIYYCDKPDEIYREVETSTPRYTMTLNNENELSLLKTFYSKGQSFKLNQLDNNKKEIVYVPITNRNIGEFDSYVYAQYGNNGGADQPFSISQLAKISFQFKNIFDGRTSGDPHVFPVYGKPYELLPTPHNYRMLQGEQLIMNASTRKINATESEEIKTYYEKVTKRETPSTLTTNGCFYKQLYVESDGNKMLVHFDTNEIQLKQQENYFKITEKVYDNKHPYELDENIYEKSIEFEHSQYGRVVLELRLFNNPQIKYGFGIKMESVNDDMEGLLLHEYNVSSAIITHLMETETMILSKEKNHTYTTLVPFTK